jgi:hypothetical protein
VVEITYDIQQCIAWLKERPMTSEKKLWREDIIPKALITYSQAFGANTPTENIRVVHHSDFLRIHFGSVD